MPSLYVFFSPLHCTLYFETVSLTDPRAYQFDRQAGQRLFCLCFSSFGSTGILAFYMDDEDPNSRPFVGISNTSMTKSSPQAFNVFLISSVCSANDYYNSILGLINGSGIECNGHIKRLLCLIQVSVLRITKPLIWFLALKVQLKWL